MNPYRPVISGKVSALPLVLGMVTIFLALLAINDNPGSWIGQGSLVIGILCSVAGGAASYLWVRDNAAQRGWDEGNTAAENDCAMKHGGMLKSPSLFPGLLGSPGSFKTYNEMRKFMGLGFAPEEEEPRKKRPPAHKPHGPTDVEMDCPGCRYAIKEVLKTDA